VDTETISNNEMKISLRVRIKYPSDRLLNVAYVSKLQTSKNFNQNIGVVIMEALGGR
jgi:hypothetical protein